MINNSDRAFSILNSSQGGDFLARLQSEKERKEENG